MKAFILPYAVVPAVAAAAVTDAQPVGECAGVVRDLSSGALVMKVLALLCTVVLAVAPSVVANAQSDNGCAPGLVKNINDVASLIDQNASAYWAHRANFVALIFGPPNAATPVVPDPQTAEQEKSQADAVKAEMPGRVNSLKGLLTAAEAQGGCDALISNVVEPSIKHGKRVSFDQFPPEEQLEEPTGPGPPRMPKN
jgi:hypothetical protein